MIARERGHRILVLGAGYAGMVAALRTAGRTRRQGAEVTVVNASDRFVERIRMHQRAAGQSLRDVSIPEMLKGTGAAFVEGWVSALDPECREVRVSTPEGDRSPRYDTLINALGSTADTGAVPGASEYAHTLNGPAAADRLYAASRAAPAGARLVVCGGGFTGIEVATELAETFPGLRVSIVTAGELGKGLSPRGRGYVAKALARRGIEVQTQTAIQAVRAASVELAGREEVPFDICFWAGSFAPSPLAGIAGLEVNNRGQAVVDPFLRSRSHPEIFVVGDAAHPAVEPRGPIRMSAGTALTMGAHAADTIGAM
ncbi:MAG: NAD(P)/FAD-dependent oxidoreductase, partial [Fimbriimonadales bacterium]